MKIDPYLSPCKKLKSKWIKDLNIKLATLKLTEEKVESSLEGIGTGNHFRNITAAAQTLRETIKWDLLKLKSFCKAKDMINKAKQQTTEWEKTHIRQSSDLQNIQRTQDIGHKKNS